MGGNPDTAFWHNDGSRGWIVAGVGFIRKNSDFSLLTKADWHHLLEQEKFDPALLDGHFVVLRWNAGRLECFTDQLGIRTLYFGKCAHGICISTRLDWVAQSLKSPGIDYPSLGAKWLLLNQFSFESGISGIERLGPCGHAAFNAGEVVRSVPGKRWIPSFEPTTPDIAIRTLQEFVRCALTQRDQPSLGLSGGLDSRFLLALFANLSKDGFSTHTFGDCCDPDLQVAHRISMALGIPHRQFNDPLPDVQTCISGLKSFAAQAALSEPASSYLKLRYYSSLRANGKIMVDGGFGEIARRKFFNRLLRFRKRALLRRDSARLASYVSAHRADIFSPEINTALQRGAVHDVEKTLDKLPDTGKIGFENLADLLAISARLPNYVCHEQARIDGEVLNFMPFLQPSYLREVFGLPLEVRSRGGLHHRFIREFNSDLTHFPLSKGGVTYPYGSSTARAMFTSILKSGLGKKYTDPKPDLLLTHLREFVLDTVHSKDVVENPAYDYQKVSDAVAQYYSGDSSRRLAVDWWLTFELWRQSLSPPAG